MFSKFTIIKNVYIFNTTFRVHICPNLFWYVVVINKPFTISVFHYMFNQTCCMILAFQCVHHKCVWVVLSFCTCLAFKCFHHKWMLSYHTFLDISWLSKDFTIIAFFAIKYFKRLFTCQYHDDTRVFLHLQLKIFTCLLWL